MAEQRLRLSRQVQASPEQLWTVLTDLDHAVENLSQVTEIHLITAGPYAVGTGWRERRRMLGASDSQEQWVVENDPKRRTVLESASGSNRYRTTITLDPLDDGAATQLTLIFEAISSRPGALQRVAMKVIGPLGTTLTERALRTELNDIAEAAEGLARQAS